MVGQETPELTRYVYDEDGSLSVGDTVSFANFGITEGIRAVRVVDDESGWVSAQGQIFEFDPSDMTIVRDIELDELEREGSNGPSDQATGRSFLAGNSLFFSIGWHSISDDTIFDEVALVHVDIERAVAGEAPVTAGAEVAALWDELLDAIESR